LKFTKEIFGDTSVEVVEPYLILAQSCLGLQNTKQAEEYLSLAKWIVLNDPTCSDRIKSRLHQLMGRLYYYEQDLEKSKEEYASSVFYSAKCYGAEAIATSSGYYALGDVFLSQGNVECSLAFFDKVVDIWYKYLSALHTRALDGISGTAGGLAAAVGNGDDTSSLNPSPPLEEPTEAQLTDGKNHLLQILEHRKRLLGEQHIATGEVQYSIGLYEFFIVGNEVSAFEFMNMAYNIYEIQLGSAHNSTLHVKAVMNLVQQQRWDDN
jgi:tetratricopeptide (TPR) repeat protein